MPGPRQYNSDVLVAMLQAADHAELDACRRIAALSDQQIGEGGVQRAAYLGSLIATSRAEQRIHLWVMDTLKAAGVELPAGRSRDDGPDCANCAGPIGEHERMGWNHLDQPIHLEC